MLARSLLQSHSERSTLFAHILRLALANGALLRAGAQRLSAPSGSVQQEASSSPKLAAGAIIGIGIGIAVLLTVVTMLVFLVVRRRRRKSRNYAMMPESSGRGRTNRMHGTRHSPSPVVSATGGLPAIRPVLLLGSSITGVPR